MNKGDKVFYKNEVYTYDSFHSSGDYEDRDLKTWHTIIDKDGIHQDIEYPYSTNITSVEILERNLKNIKKEIKELKDKKSELKNNLLLLQ